MASKNKPARDWAELLEKYRHGDDTQEGFCQRRGINIWTFRSHLYKKRHENRSDRRPGKEQAVRFVEVKPQLAELTTRGCRIRLGAATLELEHLPPAEWIAALLGSYRV